MKLIFWQNCISPHQLPYIKELYKDERVEKVFLIAPVINRTERKLMGWEQDSTNIEGVTVIISPTKEQVIEILNTNVKDSIHLFSGIRADKSVYEYFKLSLAFNLKRGIITEPPFDYKKPLFLHKIRFLFYDYKYNSKISYVFGMGDNAVEYYNLWSKKWKVFLFGYSVEVQYNQHIFKSNDKLRLVYIGSLIKRKNVKLLLNAIRAFKSNENITLDVVGDGPEFEILVNLHDKYNLNKRVSFIGKLSMTEIHKRLSDYDVLILPSLHDGWGAVINEGLQSGLYIISSDNCGAKTLIENSDRGLIFRNKNIESLTCSLQYCLQNLRIIKEGKTNRIVWANKISGESMAKYMIDCLTKDEFILPPWKK